MTRHNRAVRLVRPWPGKGITPAMTSRWTTRFALLIGFERLAPEFNPTANDRMRANLTDIVCFFTAWSFSA
jgi:hypothetical protein